MIWINSCGYALLGRSIGREALMEDDGTPPQRPGSWLLPASITALALVLVWVTHATGQAQLPHTLAGLTLALPFGLFGVVLRNPWPAVVGLTGVAALIATL